MDRGSRYRKARLKRDHPDIAAVFDRGEYPSIHAACKAAGIVHDPTPSTTCTSTGAKNPHQVWDRLKTQYPEGAERGGAILSPLIANGLSCRMAGRGGLLP